MNNKKRFVQSWNLKIETAQVVQDRSQPYLCPARNTEPSQVAPRLLFLRNLAVSLPLKHSVFAFSSSIYPIGGVDLLPSLYRLTRRFVETHHFASPEQNILEPQISITPDPHSAFWRASTQWAFTLGSDIICHVQLTPRDPTTQSRARVIKMPNDLSVSGVVDSGDGLIYATAFFPLTWAGVVVFAPRVP
jgi:hypothetical protein